MKKRIGMVIAGMALAMTVLITGCDNNKSTLDKRLVGRWALVEGETYNNPENMELLSDGTGIVDQQGFTWKTVNRRFYLTNPLIAKSWNYTVSGSTLTLIDDDDDVFKYKKIGKNDKAANPEDASHLIKGMVERLEATEAHTATPTVLVMPMDMPDYSGTFKEVPAPVPAPTRR